MPVRILRGDCREVLRTLPDASVHCVVTSPPYYGLREYGTATWEGGDPACDHRSVMKFRKFTNGQGEGVDGDGYAGSNLTSWTTRDATPKARCPRCGATRIDKQIGLEASPDAYVAEMVAVFREVRRVLRDDGTLWLNIGDSYTSGGRATFGTFSPDSKQATHTAIKSATGAPQPEGLKPKDLMMMPARVALALRADGWWIRSDIIWAKPNPMPESVTDRPTSAHEHVFVLTKSARYFYDADAVREGRQGDTHSRGTKRNPPIEAAGIGHKNLCGYMTRDDDLTSRNLRNVWTIATAPFGEAHFATFPPELAERCIKAGTSKRGCCPACGSPWTRVVEKSRTFESGSGRAGNLPEGKHGGKLQGGGETLDVRRGPVVSTATTVWLPSCLCPPADPVPCVVLDPFGGAGTVGLVADRIGRDAVLIELNDSYCEMARRRLERDAGLFADVAVN